MSNIKSNYGVEKKTANPSSKPADIKDIEAEMLRHVGGSFVYVKTKKFIEE